MKLYALDESKKNLLIYKLSPKEKEIRDYKAVRVKNSALRTNCYQFMTTDKTLLEKINREDNITFKELNMGDFNGTINELENIGNTDNYTLLKRMSSFDCEEFLFERKSIPSYLDCYINGNYSFRNLVSVYLGDIQNEASHYNNFLWLDTNRTSVIGKENRECYFIDMMLDLPLDLYALELFDSENYRALVTNSFLLHYLPFHFYDVVDSNICDSVILNYDEMKEVKEILPYTQKILTKCHDIQNKK